MSQGEQGSKAECLPFVQEVQRRHDRVRSTKHLDDGMTRPDQDLLSTRTTTETRNVPLGTFNPITWTLHHSTDHAADLGNRLSFRKAPDMQRPSGRSAYCCTVFRLPLTYLSEGQKEEGVHICIAMGVRLVAQISERGRLKL